MEARWSPVLLHGGTVVSAVPWRHGGPQCRSMEARWSPVLFHEGTVVPSATQWCKGGLRCCSMEARWSPVPLHGCTVLPGVAPWRLDDYRGRSNGRRVYCSPMAPHYRDNAYYLPRPPSVPKRIVNGPGRRNGEGWDGMGGGGRG